MGPQRLGKSPLFKPLRSAGLGGVLGLFYSFVSLVHILNVAFQHQKIRCVDAINFECATIVPFNRTFNLLAVEQHEYHGRVRVNLLFVVKDFGAGFQRRGNALAHLYRGCGRLCRPMLTVASAAITSAVRMAVPTLSGWRSSLTDFSFDLCERRS